MACLVEMVEVVLAIRGAGEPSLPYHLLRKGKVCSGLFQILVLEVCAPMWAKVEDRRHAGQGSTLFMSWF